jgi:hypothetical protein
VLHSSHQHIVSPESANGCTENTPALSNPVGIFTLISTVTSPSRFRTFVRFIFDGGSAEFAIPKQDAQPSASDLQSPSDLLLY